jgi:murein L,D-transpeptidase YcbB/YkuD
MAQTSPVAASSADQAAVSAVVLPVTGQPSAAADAANKDTPSPLVPGAAQPLAAESGSTSPSTSDATAEAAASEKTAQDGNPIRAEVLRVISDAKPGAMSREDKAALTAFYEARIGELLWVTDSGFNAKAGLAMAEIQRADDWGLNSSDFALPASLESGATPDALADAEIKLTQAVLKYAKYARGGRMDPKQLSNYIDRDPPLLKPEVVLQGIAAVEKADEYLRKLHPQHPQFEKLRQAYIALRSGSVPPQAEEETSASSAAWDSKRKQAQATISPEKALERRVLYNMEQWRWMPEDLGSTYVWANIPEFTIRVMKNGAAIHTERIIVGKTDTQTPIFSDNMETIVFHPFWGVPDSIKVKELLPGLARGGNVLEKNGLRIQYRGRDVDPYSVDWTTVDIRNFHVYQPPGGSNVLGVVKFLFPNKHQVYFHDTPTKNLFNASQRTFSHGCMRVRNPVRLAEVLLGEDKGWDAKRVDVLVKGGPQDNGVPVDKKFPVHITYFTTWVDDDGKLNTRPDVYGHEPLIQMGLDGKASQIVKRKQDLGPVRAEVVGRLAETKANGWSKQPSWIKNMFNF